MGCSSSRPDSIILPSANDSLRERHAHVRRSNLANISIGMTRPTRDSAGNTTESLLTDINNLTAEIFIIRGGIFIVTGNRIIAFTINPSQQQRRQQQQLRDTSAYIASRIRSQSIHQFYLESMELRQLQDNLLRLGHLFDTSILHDDRNSRTRDDLPPPASDHVRSSLPTISVTEQDLLIQQNRECCICCTDYGIGEVVIKLPCGHLFHHQCVIEWLGSHHTCPMCRWELETDDPYFEPGRVERMKSRSGQALEVPSESISSDSCL